MKVLVIQNHERVDGDMVEAVLRRRALAYVVAKTFRPDPLPDVKAFDAVVVLGSPASCVELEEHPDLLRAHELVARCVDADRAILGTCLGGQLLARVLGANVRRNEAGEFGCCQVMLTKEGARSPYFEGFPRSASFWTVQWHHDTFGLPNRADLLATSALCRNQAFAVGRSVGLQFHMEASPRTVAQWVEAYPQGLVEAGRSADDVLAECRRTAAEHARLCDLFVGNFLKHAER
ncbi:MAG: type 1 glutamine amidotransferase [Phycisphaerae bacterium]|nr:type 1 glutamine amidotransferase [Phycisphaerae bacterium]